MLKHSEGEFMQRITGAGICFLFLLAGAVPVRAADDTAPAAINFQYQVQAVSLSAIQKPEATVKYSILDANKTTVLLSGTTVTYMDTNGVCNIQITGNSLKDVFTGSGADERYIRLDFLNTSGSYVLGDVLRLVTAPYAYMADELEGASGNFTVGGNLSVKNAADVRALSVDGSATISGNLIVRGMNNTPDPVWVKTNALQNNTLEVGQTATFDGGVTFNADVTAPVSSAFQSNVTVGGNMTCSNGATVKGCSPGFGSIQSAQSSGNPPNGKSGFLLIYMSVTSKSTSGMTVTIDSKTYTLRNSQEANSASDDGYQSVSYTFFVRAGSSWSSTADDDVSPSYYWCDML